MVIFILRSTSWKKHFWDFWGFGTGNLQKPSVCCRRCWARDFFLKVQTHPDFIVGGVRTSKSIKQQAKTKTNFRNSPKTKKKTIYWLLDSLITHLINHQES